MNTGSSKGPKDQLAAMSRLRNVLLGHAKTQRLIFTFILHSQAPESYCLSQSVTTSCCKRHLLHDTLKVWTKMESWNSALCYVPLCQLSPEKGRRQQDTKGYTVLQKSDRRYLPAVYHWVVHWQASCICKLAESWWIGQTNNKKRDHISQKSTEVHWIKTFSNNFWSRPNQNHTAFNFKFQQQISLIQKQRLERSFSKASPSTD